MCKFCTREEINNLKTYIMSSYRYCEKVYNSIEDDLQFQTWFNLCTAHVNSCNFLLKKSKPLITFIPTKHVKVYKEFEKICKFTVESIQNLINEYNAEKQKSSEELELMTQLEMKARLEHRLTTEYKEFELQNQKELISKNQIGFKLNKQDEQ